MTDTLDRTANVALAATPASIGDDTELRFAKDMPAAPVTWLASDAKRPPADGVGLSLSGGGTRAMLFHAGAILRLCELGLLPSLDRISGVSGGSIFAGVLALKWPKILAEHNPAQVYRNEVIDPLREFARQPIDIFAWLRGTLLRGKSPIERLVAALDDVLFDGATLQDLPDHPRFVFNATNLSTGVLWRFSKPYMADYRLGCIPRPRVPLAVAVAASSAFPPFFSPLRRRVDPARYSTTEECRGQTLSSPPAELHAMRKRPRLADGGVYDNLALETVWKGFRNVLVSDGGGGFQDQAAVPSDLILQSVRVTQTIDRQVRALRRNILIRSYQEAEGPGIGWRRGAYWGIRTDIDDYKAPGKLPCPTAHTRVLADEPTRLWRMAEVTQERLINWGYAVADAAVRAYYGPVKEAPSPLAFPYPDIGVG
jgi:NTE family protein